MRTRRLWILPLMAGLLLVPLTAGADSHEMGPKPLTWVSFVQSQTGKSMPLAQHLAENGAKIYDGLMADGHILQWGVGMAVNHRADDQWNIAEWVVFRDWAAVDAFMQAFMGMQMAKSPEDMKAEQEKWLSLVVPGSHYDEIYRELVVVPSAGPPPRYLSLTYVPGKPGQGEALQKLWVDNVKPTLAKLQEAGTIGSFGMSGDEIHDGSGTGYMLWTQMPNLAARDAVDAAMEADAKERGKEAQMEMMKGFYAAVDFPAHHDRIVMVTHNGGGGGGEGE